MSDGLDYEAGEWAVVWLDNQKRDSVFGGVVISRWGLQRKACAYADRRAAYGYKSAVITWGDDLKSSSGLENPRIRKALGIEDKS
jgi:hypothetical protein